MYYFFHTLDIEIIIRISNSNYVATSPLCINIIGLINFSNLDSILYTIRFMYLQFMHVFLLFVYCSYLHFFSPGRRFIMV